jgi:dehydrogenase/reductase SDR family member 12
MSFGQFAATTQFYLFGKAHCTRTGWEKAVLKYQKPDILEESIRSLVGRVYLVTGANTGIGKEISTHLAKKGATVYMVCRNLEKAQKARDEIVEISKSPSVHILQCDCSLEADVRKLWKNFETAQKACITETKDSSAKVRLDGLVCNAGALMNEKTLTTEGVEVIKVSLSCAANKI